MQAEGLLTAGFIGRLSSSLPMNPVTGEAGDQDGRRASRPHTIVLERMYLSAADPLQLVSETRIIICIDNENPPRAKHM
jgi:hypothetical protein